MSGSCDMTQTIGRVGSDFFFLLFLLMLSEWWYIMQLFQFIVHALLSIGLIIDSFCKCYILKYIFSYPLFSY